MYDVLHAFFCFIMSCLDVFEPDHELFTLIYALILFLAVWTFLRRIFSCICHSI